MSNHPYPRRAWRLAGAAGLTIGLAAGGYGIASAASGTTTTTPPTSSTQAPNASGAAPATGGAPGGRRGPRAGMGVKGFAAVRGGGTITAITDSSITVSGPNGATRQVTTNASTTYHRDGATAQRSDLAVGERVMIRPVKPPAGSGSTPPGSAATQPVTAADVNIVSPVLEGTVTKVDGSTITITDGQGFSRTIKTSGSTTYDIGGQPGSASDVTTGATIRALGNVDANKTDLDATKVSVVLPRVAGTVQSVSNGTITLTEPGGGTVTVTTTPATVYHSGGKSAAFSDIKAGDFLTATGHKQPDGSMAATSITFGTLPAKAGPGAPGGPGVPGGPFAPGGPFGGGGFGRRGPAGPPAGGGADGSASGSSTGSA